MTIDWEHKSIPLGQGLETRASEKMLPPGKLTKAVNVSFKTPGQLSKRPGMADNLGFNVAQADALAVLGDHLLARANGELYDYQPQAKPSQPAGPIRNPGQAWKNLGPQRAVPASSQIVKGSLDGIVFTDSYAVAGLRCILWSDSTGVVTARVMDEDSGAVITEQVLATQDPTAKNFNQVTGGSQVIGTKFFIILNTKLWTWTSATNSWTSHDFVVQLLINFPTLNVGTLYGARICMVGSDFLVLLAYSTGLAFGRYAFGGSFVSGKQWNDLLCVPGPISLSVSLDLATIWAAACTQQDAEDWSLVGVGYIVASDLHKFKILETLTAPGFQERDGTVATKINDIRHVTVFPRLGRAAFVWDIYTPFSDQWYADDASDSFNKRLRKAELSVTVPGLGLDGPHDWLRGVSLVSDAVGVGNSSVMWLAYSQFTIASTITGFAETTSLNAAYFLMDYETSTVCAKLLQQQALEQASTSSASISSRGVTSAALATTRADVTKLTLQRGTVALLTADFSTERMRADTAQRNVLMTGGSPTAFDGTALTEQGFFVYPEFRVIGSNTKPPALAIKDAEYLQPYPMDVAWAMKTKYVVGDMLILTSGDPLLGGQGVTIRIALTAGVSGGAEPVWPVTTGQRTQDNSITWVSYYLGKLPGSWQPGITHAMGDQIFVPSVGAFLTVIVAGTSDVTEPDWLAYKVGSSIPDGGSLIYFWGSTFSPGYFRNAIRQDGGLYTEGICAVYEWVDDAGELHQSSPSVVQSFPIVSIFPTTTVTVTARNPDGSILSTTTIPSPYGNFLGFRYSYLISTLRITKKQNVFIAIYRTADDGTLLQKIGQVLNDPTVDALVFNDDIGDDRQAEGVILYAGQAGAGELPNEQACSCSLIKKWGRRIVTNDLENPGQVRASKLLADGYGPAFSSELVIPVNPAYGPVTGFAVMDDKLVIFHAEHIGVVSSGGPDNTGGGQAFAEIEYVLTDTGCINPDSIVGTPGGLLFLSGKGLFGLSRGLETGYSGAAVENADTSISYTGTGIGFDYPLDLPFGETDPAVVTTAINVGKIVSAEIAPQSTEVRFLTDGGVALIYDTVSNEWALWTVGGVDAIVYGGEYVVLTADGLVMRETSGYHMDADGTFVAVAFKLASLRFDGVQGFGKLRHIALLLESSGETAVELKIYDDYGVSAVQETAQFLLNGPQQLRCRPTHAKAQAVALEFIEVPSADVDLKISGIDVLVGIIGKLNRVPPTNRM